MNNEELVKEIQNGINVTENMERLYENNLYNKEAYQTIFLL